MKLETALKVIQKDADFLGVSHFEMMKIIQKEPLAHPNKTLEAFKVIKSIVSNTFE